MKGEVEWNEREEIRGMVSLPINMNTYLSITLIHCALLLVTYPKVKHPCNMGYSVFLVA